MLEEGAEDVAIVAKAGLQVEPLVVQRRWAVGQEQRLAVNLEQVSV